MKRNQTQLSTNDGNIRCAWKFLLFAGWLKKKIFFLVFRFLNNNSTKSKNQKIGNEISAMSSVFAKQTNFINKNWTHIYYFEIGFYWLTQSTFPCWIALRHLSYAQIRPIKMIKSFKFNDQIQSTFFQWISIFFFFCLFRFL